MKIYTKQGDAGASTVAGGKKLQKDDICFELLGTLDELNSYLGIVKCMVIDLREKEYVECQQHAIMNVSAHLAGYINELTAITPEFIVEMEQKIDELQALYPPIKKLIIPGENEISAQIDIARTVCRRAERLLISYGKQYSTENNIRQWLNRLSDYIYALARYMEFFMQVEQSVKKAVNNQNKAIQTTPQHSMTLEKAKKLIDALEKKAEEMKLPAVFAVCNNAGNPIVVEAMDGAYLISFELALKKAYTAVALKMPTEELHKLAEPWEMFHGIEAASEKLIVLAGGVPLYENDIIVGGLGVSGGTDKDDVSLCSFGAEIVNNPPPKEAGA